MKKILIIGAGNIGGALCCYLWGNSEADITLYDANSELIKKIADCGITLERAATKASSQKDGKPNSLTARPKTATCLNDIESGCVFDIVLIAVRAYYLHSASTSILPFIDAHSLVFAFNNGVCVNELADVVGVSRAVGCSVDFGIGTREPARLYEKISGGIHAGMLTKTQDARLREATALLGKSMPVSVTDNIIGMLYSKMLINSCITSSAVLSGKTLGDILGSKSGRRFFIEIVREGMAIADAAEITVPPYLGKLNYRSFIARGVYPAIFRSVAFAKLKKQYGFRTSTTLDRLREGVRTETDFFNGYVVRLGKKYGVSCPLNKAVCETIANIEKDISVISPDNIRRLLRESGVIK